MSDLVQPTVLSSPEEAVTFAQLRRSVSEAAAELHDLGVRPGDRVVLAGPGILRGLVVFWGLRRVGAVAVTVHRELTPVELTQLMHDCRPVAVSAEPGLARALDAAADSCGLSVRRLSATPPAPTAMPPMRYEGVDSDLAIIAYRGGAPGDPRVTTLKWGDLAPNGPTGRRNLVCALPFQDLVELATGCLRVLRAGGQVHCVDPHDAAVVVATVADRQATDLAAGPHLLAELRRFIAAELMHAPIHELAVFQGLQANETHTADERRSMLAWLYSRLGARLQTVHSCGGPLDPQTTEFLTRMGLDVREGFA